MRGCCCFLTAALTQHVAHVRHETRVVRYCVTRLVTVLVLVVNRVAAIFVMLDTRVLRLTHFFLRQFLAFGCFVPLVDGGFAA